MQLAAVAQPARAADATPVRAALHAPAGPDDLAGHYDLTVSRPEVDPPPAAPFDRWLAEAAAGHGLACALIHDGLVGEAVHRLAAGRMTVGCHLDYAALWHRPDDPYARLAEAVEDAGGRSINAPARARAFTDKAAAHAALARRGLGVPATVILRPWAAARGLTAGERARLWLDAPGAAAYVKPANGFAGRGVSRVASPDPGALAAALSAARAGDPADALLVQREVRPPALSCEDGAARPAYWRVLYCLGEVLPFWWQPQERVGHGRPSYRALTPAELLRHNLGPVRAYARALAELTGLDWFSTELCLGDGAEPSCFTVPGADGRAWPVLAVDYVNDQCDVEVQSRWAGAAPDDVVRRLAGRFAEEAWRLRQRALRPEAVLAYRAAA
jgi:hypothetical protein